MPLPHIRSNVPLPEAILAGVLESVTDAVVTIDEDHKVLLCNKAAEKMFGYTCAEILGRDVSPLIPEPHQSVHRGYVNRYMETNVPHVIGESRECVGLRKDGTTFPVEISYSVSEMDGRQLFTAVIRDISQRKDLEREMRFMQKLADVGKAVAQVVHEIRKPLVLIGGFARQVSACDALKNDSKERYKLSIIMDEVRRLETLLNGIRLLTRPPGSSCKRLLPVEEMIWETLGLLEPMLKDRHVDLVVDNEDEPLPIQGDPDQLKQVFLNLFQNSVEAMEGHGTLRVEWRRNGASARITLTDTGPGIPEELRDKVFDPFFTTKSEGTGLGLAISKNIIQDHGGRIILESPPAGGAVFIIEMPLAVGG